MKILDPVMRNTICVSRTYDLLFFLLRSPVFREDSFWALVTSALERLTPEQSGALAGGILKIYPW